MLHHIGFRRLLFWRVELLPVSPILFVSWMFMWWCGTRTQRGLEREVGSGFRVFKAALLRCTGEKPHECSLLFSLCVILSYLWTFYLSSSGWLRGVLEGNHHCLLTDLPRWAEWSCSGAESCGLIRTQSQTRKIHLLMKHSWEVEETGSDVLTFLSSEIISHSGGFIAVKCSEFYTWTCFCTSGTCFICPCVCGSAVCQRLQGTNNKLKERLKRRVGRTRMLAGNKASVLKATLIHGCTFSIFSFQRLHQGVSKRCWSTLPLLGSIVLLAAMLQICITFMRNRRRMVAYQRAAATRCQLVFHTLLFIKGTETNSFTVCSLIWKFTSVPLNTSDNSSPS